MLEEFKKFAMRGNVVDMAVGIIIGGAFGKIVSSFVNDVIMPPIGMLMGGVDFSNLYINLSEGSYASLAEAQEAGAAPGDSVGFDKVPYFDHIPILIEQRSNRLLWQRRINSLHCALPISASHAPPAVHHDALAGDETGGCG